MTYYVLFNQIIAHAVQAQCYKHYTWIVIVVDDLDYVELTVIPSLVPGSPLFFVLRFAFSIMHGSGKARKTGKAWEHLSRE